MEYNRRVIDDELDELMPALPAIALEGAKGVGKTATASARVTTTFDLSDPRQRQIVAADPDLIATSPPPVLLDEWQLEPTVWNRVRHLVDADPTAGGRFLLTGSAGPTRDVKIHSGAGRIVRLVMRPLAMCERGRTTPTVSLTSLFAPGEALISGQSPLRLTDYTEEILRSGFPGIRNLPPRACRMQLDSYLSRILDHDLEESGAVVRRPAALRAWLTAYAAATATTATHSVILDAATPGEGDKPARQTVAVYRENLERLFLLDPLPAWAPSLSPLTRLTVSPKHHLVDPALAARLIGIDAAALLRGEGERVVPTDGTLLGALFESLAAQTVRVLAQAVEARVGHLRTKNGDQEIDLITEGPDRRVVAFEVKLNPVVVDDDVRHLRWLRESLGERVADMVVLTTGAQAYRRPDGVAVVPLALLGP